MHVSPCGSPAKHGRPNFDLQLLPPGGSGTSATRSRISDTLIIGPFTRSVWKNWQWEKQSCALPSLQREGAESRSCSNSIQDAVKDGKFGRSLPLSAQEQTKNSQKNPVMWKSVFLNCPHIPPSVTLLSSSPVFPLESEVTFAPLITLSCPSPPAGHPHSDLLTSGLASPGGRSFSP